MIILLVSYALTEVQLILADQFTVQSLHAMSHSLREKCLYSELLWSVFFRIRTEYGEALRISLYSVRMRENMDQNNSEYRHFLRSDYQINAKNAVRKTEFHFS